MCEFQNSDILIIYITWFELLLLLSFINSKSLLPILLKLKLYTFYTKMLPEQAIQKPESAYDFSWTNETMKFM